MKCEPMKESAIRELQCGVLMANVTEGSNEAVVVHSGSDHMFVSAEMATEYARFFARIASLLAPGCEVKVETKVLAQPSILTPRIPAPEGIPPWGGANDE
jgi:hypothetical protein